jgi:uncharacterized protein
MRRLLALLLCLCSVGCRRRRLPDTPEAACREGIAVGCGVLGDEAYEAKDFPRACALYRQACSGKVQTACANLGPMILQHKCTGTTAEAVEILEGACRLGEGGGCNNLGVIFRDGADGIRPDRQRAHDAFRRGCPAAAVACNNLGTMSIDQDHDGAVAAFTAGCDANDGSSSAWCCYKLGLIHEEGHGTPADPATALSFFRRACAMSQPDACYLLALSEMEAGDPSKDASAVGFLRRACDGKHGGACNNLGLMYATGRGISRDGARAVEYVQEACVLGVLEGCANAGQRYLVGDGVAKDVDRGTALIDRACRGGLAEACKLLPGASDGP